MFLTISIHFFFCFSSRHYFSLYYYSSSNPSPPFWLPFSTLSPHLTGTLPPTLHPFFFFFFAHLIFYKFAITSSTPLFHSIHVFFHKKNVTTLSLSLFSCFFGGFFTLSCNSALGWWIFHVILRLCLGLMSFCGLVLCFLITHNKSFVYFLWFWFDFSSG